MSSNVEKILKELESDQSHEVSSEDENETVWLISYADLMTLLFTFFVMLFAAVEIDSGKTLRSSLFAYLQGTGTSNVTTGANENLETLKKAMSARLVDEQFLNDIEITTKKNGLNITFSSSLFYDLGAAELRDDAKKTLIKMISVIKEKGPDLKIRVEGHTDDNAITGASRFKSNWELSAARAADLVELFEKQGIHSKNLLAIGYGSSRPLLPNRTPAGEKDLEAQRRNRRVVLTVYSVQYEEVNNK